MNQCEVCGAPHRNLRFCSPPCRHIGRRKAEVRVCPSCGGDFTVRPSATQRSCSLKCAGAARSGPNNVRYNGGFSKAENRTIVCTRDGGYVFWYRIVMEDHIGRPLTPDELVHHINGDPTDDRLENLQLVKRGEHMEMHREEIGAAYKRTLEARDGLPHRWDLKKYREQAA